MGVTAVSMKPCVSPAMTTCDGTTETKGGSLARRKVPLSPWYARTGVTVPMHALHGDPNGNILVPETGLDRRFGAWARSSKTPNK